MRIRHLALSVAALLGSVALATAQQPVPVPVVPTAPAAMAAQAAPAPYATPVLVVAQPGCGTPACAPCVAPAKKSVFDRLCGGTASPVGCGCLAAERTFAFGSCKSFFTPGRTCNGEGIEYGCGSGECRTPKDRCKNITSFLER